MNGGQRRVLVVDDDELMREMIARVLRKSGWRCDCAVDGVEGLRRARASSYDLILTDLGMPELDGFDFIREVRAEGRNAGTPILVVSCRALDPEAFVREQPVQGYLAKPFGREELLEAVRQALGEPAASAPGPARKAAPPPWAREEASPRSQKAEPGASTFR